MRVKEERQLLTGQERDREPSMEADQEGSDIVDNDEEEDTDDESIDIPPNPENEMNIERLRAENTMLRELAARREMIRKEMQEYREKLIGMISAISDDAAQTETARDEREEYRRRLMEEIIDMVTHLDPQKQTMRNTGDENPLGEEEPVDS